MILPALITGVLLAAAPVIAAAAEAVRADERLSGWPSRLLVDRGTLPKSDPEFLRRVAADTWRGLAALRDRENGLPVDHVSFGNGSVDPLHAEIGHYTTTSSIGLFLVAVVAARELALLSDLDAELTARKVLESLQRLETYRGFCFNFYDTTSLGRTTDFLSFVDSAWLTAGLMVVRAAIPQLRDPCTRHIEQLDLGFFYHASERLMWHGYHVDRWERSTYHYGAFFTEARLGSLIAIGKGEAPAEHWPELAPSFPRCTRETALLEAHDDPKPAVQPANDCREWRQFRYVPSWGGSMFEALMPTLVADESRLTPGDVARNAQVHATVQRLYALDVHGYPVWGMSPSAVPGSDGFRYAEYGVQVLGSAGYPPGVVTPHAAALALSVTPEAAVANLRKLAELYDVYGEYGFYDAVDPRTGEVAHVYLALDQSMILIALANHLRDGSIQKLFASDPIARAAFSTLNEGDRR